MDERTRIERTQVFVRVRTNTDFCPCPRFVRAWSAHVRAWSARVRELKKTPRYKIFGVRVRGQERTRVSVSTDLIVFIGRYHVTNKIIPKSPGISWSVISKLIMFPIYVPKLFPPISGCLQRIKNY